MMCADTLPFPLPLPLPLPLPILFMLSVLEDELEVGLVLAFRIAVIVLAVRVAVVVLALVGLEAKLESTEEVEVGKRYVYVGDSPLPSSYIFVIVSATIPLPFQRLLAPTSQTHGPYIALLARVILL